VRSGASEEGGRRGQRVGDGEGAVADGRDDGAGGGEEERRARVGAREDGVFGRGLPVGTSGVLLECLCVDFGIGKNVEVMVIDLGRG